MEVCSESREESVLHENPLFASLLASVHALMRQEQAQGVLSVVSLHHTLAGHPIGLGWRWIALVKGTGLWSGLPIRIELNYSPYEKHPVVRYRSILDGNDDILEFGYLPPDYYSSLPDAYILGAQQYLEKSPALRQFSVQEIERLWKHHPHECQCQVFPITYQALCMHTAKHKEAAINAATDMINHQEVMKFRRLKEYITRRTTAILGYKKVHPELFNITQGWREAWFDPAFQEVLKQGTPEAFVEIAEEINPGIYTFPLFRHEFCEMLMEEITNYEQSDFVKPRPNSMNHYGVILNDMGMEGMFDILLDIMRPFLAHLFSQFGGKTVDHHHSFSPNTDRFLDMHIDDSEITLNVNIQDEFTGADLAFCGMQTSPDLRKHHFSYSHRKGKCIIHPGSRRHGALNIESGQRTNLIVWCRSSEYRLDENNNYERTDRVEEPDQVCLSRTHDHDYDYWIKKFHQRAQEQGL